MYFKSISTTNLDMFQVWVLPAMADNHGCAKLGHLHSHCTFPEFNTVLGIMKILKEISFYVKSIITILDVFKV